MSAAGFDFGNSNYVVALARRGGIDVVTNEVSNRLTPSLVSFDEKQRYIGEPALNQLLSNSRNSITDLKRLIGRRLSDEDIQQDLSRVLFKVVDIGEKKIGVQVQYLNETVTFTPERLVAMMLVNMKEVAELHYGSKVSDAVISVPIYWTDEQRRALLDASEIAGLNCLRLMNETSATALGYGIVKTDLPEKDPVNVVFVDMGQSNLQVAAAAFVKGKFEILGIAYDRNLGGRNFDDVLVEHVAADWKAKHKIDVYTNPKALMRTRLGAEKLKKILSANSEGPLNIECLMNDIDVQAKIKRTDFEEWSGPLLQRVAAVCQQLLSENPKLTKDSIHAIELVGGATRMPAILKIVTEVFGKEPFRTTNSEEAVARGCALQGAMLSPAFKVREFLVHDVAPYPINVTWKSSPRDENEMAIDTSSTLQSSKVFPKYNPLPSTKLLTFKKYEPFEVQAVYADPSVLAKGVSPHIGRATITGIPPIKDRESARIKLKVKLNVHGILSADSAQLIEDDEADTTQSPAPTPAQSPGDAAPTSESPSPAPQANGPTGASPAPAPSADATSTDTPTEVPMTDDAAPKADEAAAKKKKKTRKHELQVTYYGPGMSKTEIQTAIEAEFNMALADKVVIETAERKNAVESYVYNMRTRMQDDLKDFIDAKARESYLKLLEKTEEWLYDDDTEERQKGTYISKLEELQKVGEAAAGRHREYKDRPAAIAAYTKAIDTFQAFVNSSEEKYAHISGEERATAASEVAAAIQWFQEALTKLESVPKTADPAIKVADIIARKEALEKAGNKIMQKPKPKPAPSPAPASTTPTPPESTSEPKTQSEGGSPSGGEPMQTE
eukprot:CAMPEP_0184645614 /NCGR_PEP_ID=MMETSP0308-20130426/2127_1 /TAXON_ID=38269 /ORGANISM="Gloeochaete witrockiana, Strain SAG 46.84" /LENGTH=839 /DNA_ID=CAMNT_0027074803 /DNA_START=71 /DNA_END=2590 /DNA_ORIENTATION=-